MHKNSIYLLVLLSLLLSCSDDSEIPVAICQTKYLAKVNYTQQNASPVEETFNYNDQNFVSKYTTTDITWYNFSLYYQDKKLNKVDLEAHSVVNFTFYITYNANSIIEYITRKNSEKTFDSLIFTHDNQGHVIKRDTYGLSSASQKLEFFKSENFEYLGQNVKKSIYKTYSGGNLISTYIQNFEFDTKIQPYPKEYYTFLAYIGRSFFSTNNITKLDSFDEKGNIISTQTYNHTYDNENYATQEIIKRENNDIARTSNFTLSCEPPLK